MKVKFLSKVVFASALALVPFFSLSACSPSDAGEVEASVSIDDFAAGTVSLQVYGSSSFIIAPLQSAGSPGEVGNTTLVTGTFNIDDLQIPVTYTYEVVGDASNPTHGVISMTLVDEAAYGENTSLMKGLGIADTERFYGLTITFNYVTGTCDIVASGVEPRTSALTGTEDVIVRVPQNGRHFKIQSSGY